MAIETVQSDPSGANPTEELDTLATDLQILASRVRSLAGAANQAVDDLVDGPNPVAAERIVNFTDLIDREASEIESKGERVEILTRRLKREGLEVVQ